MSIDEELMEAVNTGKSDKFELRTVGSGDAFRGYIITDAATGVRVADYIYSHALGKFELKKRPGFEKEIEMLRASMPPKDEPTALWTCDYSLCVKYVDYVLNYIDTIINNHNIDLAMKTVLQRNRDALNSGYGLAIYAAANDIEDYSQMSGFEEQVKRSIDTIRQYAVEFEKQFLQLFPEGFSFNNSPVYLEAKRQMGL